MQKTSVSFSKVQYLPVTTTAMRTAVTATNVMTGGMPNMLIAAVMPMYSVTRVIQLTAKRSKMENHPQ